MDPSVPSYSTSNASDEVLFDDLNRTELYQLCRRAGYHVHPSWERQQLINTLQDTGRQEPADEHPIDSLREGLIAFIGQYWRTLQPQLTCPAKDMRNPKPEKVNPRPCFGCSDMQVMTCVSTQKQANHQQIYQLRKKSQ